MTFDIINADRFQDAVLAVVEEAIADGNITIDLADDIDSAVGSYLERCDSYDLIPDLDDRIREMVEGEVDRQAEQASLPSGLAETVFTLATRLDKIEFGAPDRITLIGLRDDLDSLRAELAPLLSLARALSLLAIRQPNDGEQVEPL